MPKKRRWQLLLLLVAKVWSKSWVQVAAEQTALEDRMLLQLQGKLMILAWGVSRLLLTRLKKGAGGQRCMGRVWGCSQALLVGLPPPPLAALQTPQHTEGLPQQRRMQACSPSGGRGMAAMQLMGCPPVQEVLVAAMEAQMAQGHNLVTVRSMMNQFKGMTTVQYLAQRATLAGLALLELPPALRLLWPLQAALQRTSLGLWRQGMGRVWVWLLAGVQRDPVQGSTKGRALGKAWALMLGRAGVIRLGEYKP